MLGSGGGRACKREVEGDDPESTVSLLLMSLRGKPLRPHITASIKGNAVLLLSS